MKVTVRNLGIIKEAEIDLKPLTIFVGPNNAGKTWLAYTFAGILGSYGRNAYTRAYTEGKVPAVYPPLDAAVEQIYNEGNATIDLVTFADEYGESYFNNVAHFAQQWMDRFMSTDRVSFEKLEVQINLAEAKTTFLKHLLSDSLRSELSVGQRGKNPLLSLLKRPEERKLFIYTSTEEQIAEKLPREAIKEQVVRSVLRALHVALYPNVRMFPTERTGYTTLPFFTLPFVGQGSSGRLPHAQENGPLVEPVSHFLNMLLNTFERGSVEQKEREQEAKNISEIEEYIQFAQVLEKQLLSGEINFSTPEPDPRRKLLFQSTADFSVEIPIASSMVKELAPLALYLRYLAKPGDLLILRRARNESPSQSTSTTH